MPEEFERELETGVMAVTRRGKPVFTMMSRERYEAISETLEIMGDQELMNALAKSVNDIESGKTLGSAEVELLSLRGSPFFTDAHQDKFRRPK